MSDTQEEVAIEEVEEEVQMSVLDALKEVSSCRVYRVGLYTFIAIPKQNQWYLPVNLFLIQPLFLRKSQMYVYRYSRSLLSMMVSKRDFMNAPRPLTVALLAFAVSPRTVKMQSTKSLSVPFAQKVKFPLSWWRKERSLVQCVVLPNSTVRDLSRRQSVLLALSLPSLVRTLAP